MKKRISTAIMSGEYKVSTREKPRGVNKAKLDDIIQKLGPLMKSSRIRFYENLVSVDSLDDMLESE